MSTRSLWIRIIVSVLTMALVLFGVFRLIQRPVAGDTDTYTALFTDANGLRLGDDVRLYGVQVGKVRDVDLQGPLARVKFTVTQGHPLYTETKVAVRYQNLTGFRYLEIQQPDRPGARRGPASSFDTAHTVPAFDITTLFNGLQPVLAQLSPDDLNQFASSMLAVVQGDGNGIGPALDAIDKLSRYASDRQQVLSILVGNFAQVAAHMAGKSGNAMQLMTNLTDLFVTITDKLPGLVQFAMEIPPMLRPLLDLLDVLGVTGEKNRDLDALLHRVLPNPHQATEVLGRLPGLIQTLASTVPPTGPDAAMTCSRGIAVAPAPLQVLIAGQRITLCHR
ncbi:Mce family protein MceB [Nocardia nova SH22a]|uniref:Mce family protein MceB n=1 Tax=Nocardia nova SH22a TaxID=1415166 RepID=W5TKS3_9NOCA|nr:MlaD family protein [Nocardia nova]AHH19563.1 Mce family protein MceB [Nocardia nova SH22a]